MKQLLAALVLLIAPAALAAPLMLVVAYNVVRVDQRGFNQLRDALFASVPVKHLKEAAHLSALGVNVPNFKLSFPIKASTTCGRPIL